MRDEGSAGPTRIATLAEAYGADLRRWPAAEREAAQALLARGDPELRNSLARQARLDAWLDRYEVRAPSSALIGCILACAPQPALLWSRARLWWSSLGLAGVGLAGAVTGAVALSLATPVLLDHRAADWADGQTIFGEADLDGMIDG